MKKFYFFLIAFSLLFLSKDFIGQTAKLSAEFRPRFEFRNGYKSLMPDGISPAAFISQRTRFNAFFADENIKFKLVLQNVRVWGDVNQLNYSDINGISVHEAWAEIKLSKNLALKTGRQEIIYDDHRIFGNVGWTQQARSHDAAILKYKADQKHAIDFGLAYNAVKESNNKVDYLGMKNYKALQFMHYHGNFNKLGISFLELYNGVAYDSDTAVATTNEKIAWSLTIGPRFTYSAEKVKANLTFYYQGGKNGSNADLTASYFAADINSSLSESFSIGLGAEYLSGTATKNIGTGKDKSFTPLYGTNHKFNGWMDYFYVANHSGNVGLTDIFLPLKYKYDKWLFIAKPHYLMSSATVSALNNGVWKDYNNGLGTEIDLTIIYNMNKSVKLQAGYSQMLATETMEVLKGGNYKNSNNWAWFMITIKPKFFEKTINN